MSVTEYLKSRNVDFTRTKVWVDEDMGVATFPMYNLSGKLVGYQKVNPNGLKKKFNDPVLSKYYSWRNKDEIAIVGMESWNYSPVLFVVEGVFDMARLHKAGCAALSLVSNDPSQTLKNWLWTVHKMRPVVAVCDGDKAGLKLAKAGSYSEQCPPGQDLSDVSEEWFEDFLKRWKK